MLVADLYEGYIHYIQRICKITETRSSTRQPRRHRRHRRSSQRRPTVPPTTTKSSTRRNHCPQRSNMQYEILKQQEWSVKSNNLNKLSCKQQNHFLLPSTKTFAICLPSLIKRKLHGFILWLVPHYSSPCNCVRGYWTGILRIVFSGNSRGTFLW